MHACCIYVCMYVYMRWHMVCTNIWIFPHLFLLTVASPKSPSFTICLAPTKKFSALMSLWMNPFSWRCAFTYIQRPVIDFSWDSWGRCALSTLVPKACTRDFKAHYVCIVYVSLPFWILPRLCCSPDTLSRTCRGSRRCGGWADGSSDCLPRNTPAPTTYMHT